MRLDYVVRQLGRFGRLERKPAPAYYTGVVGAYTFAFAPERGRPGRLSHFCYLRQGEDAWRVGHRLGPALRRAVERRRRVGLNGVKVFVTYTLEERTLAEVVRVHDARSGRGEAFGEGAGVPFVLGREFARGESDAFLDWLQDHRPDLLEGKGGWPADRARAGSRLSVRLRGGPDRGGPGDTAERPGGAVLLPAGGRVWCVDEGGTPAPQGPGAWSR